MKKLFSIIAGLTIILFSCKKEASNLDPNSSQNMITGTGSGQNIRTVAYIWKINSLVVNGTDMTAQLAGYSFDIQAPQLSTGLYTIVAVNGSNSYYGKWNRVTYGEVIIGFSNATDALNLISGDWTLTNNQQFDIAMQTDTKSLSFHTNGDVWPNQ